MDLEVTALMLSALAVLAAGFVRGYSGFGFSMITIISLSLIFPPTEAVPAILFLEVSASAWLLPRVWRKIHWPSFGWLSAGVAGGTPLGVYLLTTVPAKPMRVAIALVVMVLIVLLWGGLKLKNMPGKGMTVATGIVSGLLNGGAAIGGPPAILLYFSSPAGAAVSRASLIAFFLGTDVLAAGACAVHGLVTVKTAFLTGILLLPLVLGVSLGDRSFTRTRPEFFRKTVLALLMMLSLAALTRAAFKG